MGQGIVLGMLGLCAVEDIKMRSITLPYLMVFGIIGVCMRWYGQELSLAAIGTGMALGVVLLGISCLTRGSIGMGDGFIFCTTGIFLGGSENAELLMVSLLYAAIWSLGILVFGKRNGSVGKRKIPFAPFVFMGYASLVLEGML